MLNNLSRFTFSKYSSRNLVPSLLKQGRFTRIGFKMLGTNRKDSQNFVERRQKRIDRPVDLTNVVDAHLYFDSYTEGQKRIQAWKDRKQSRLNLIQDAPSLEHVLQELKNPQHLTNGTWHLLFGLKLLHRHYAQEIPLNMPHILYALKRLNYFVKNLDIHNFRSLVSFGEKYTPNDQAVWQLYLQNTIRFILSYEQQQRPLLSSQTSEDIRNDFLRVFHVVVEKSFHFNLNLDNLICQLDLMMRNHYRDIKQLNNPPAGNSFENLRGDNAALFFSDYAKVMAKRVDIYNEYDRLVKEKQVQNLSTIAQKVILNSKSELTQKSLRTLKEATINFSNLEPDFKRYISSL